MLIQTVNIHKEGWWHAKFSEIFSPGNPFNFDHLKQVVICLTHCGKFCPRVFIPQEMGKQQRGSINWAGGRDGSLGLLTISPECGAHAVGQAGL